MQKVTLGGDRLGSGKKQKIALHDYERSTHDLTRKFTSSMQCGTLYPFMVIPAMRGDKFTIDLEADARTIPTKGPLFGSFKMQLDVFQCDVRLYQAILHNNPLYIGMKMGQVKFPVLNIHDAHNCIPFSNSSLIKYLGMSGLGHNTGTPQSDTYRKVNAIPALAYYEIFKTYYSNKQEENAYVIGSEKGEFNIVDETATIKIANNTPEQTYVYAYANRFEHPTTWDVQDGAITLVTIGSADIPSGWENVLNVTYIYKDRDEETYYTVGNRSIKDLIDLGLATKTNTNQFALQPQVPAFPSQYVNNVNMIALTTPWNNENGTYEYDIRGLQPFALSNIDDMRLALLSHHTLGSAFIIKDEDTDGAKGEWGTDSGTDGTGLPYVNLVSLNSEDKATKNGDPLNGLVVKTYQSDLYNCWVNTEWIDGDNGIANITAISTASGSIKIDSLNLAEKLYNMLNRVAVSDGSYEGWQDAVYTETPKRHIESPVYLGGLSSEIVFEEIVQTAPAGDTALGTLGGKGKLMIRKGGHITVKTNEAAFIIGIVSLTPRINYTQGNEFYMTDLMSMDDFHKPALDGIGFQNLIAERAAWWDTAISSGAVISRHSLGKVPAWIEYMTAVDKAFGDFAEKDGFMSLNRDYDEGQNHTIKDATTYIDPRKYNYAFAYKNIDAQNFWVQIKSNIKARRLMSAKQIPNI